MPERSVQNNHSRTTVLVPQPYFNILSPYTLIATYTSHTNYHIPHRTLTLHQLLFTTTEMSLDNPNGYKPIIEGKTWILDVTTSPTEDEIFKVI